MNKLDELIAILDNHLTAPIELMSHVDLLAAALKEIKEALSKQAQAPIQALE